MISFVSIAGSDLHTILFTLGISDDGTYSQPRAVLDLADAYAKINVLDKPSTALVANKSFREAWLLPDEVLLETMDDNYYTRVQAAMLEAKLPKELIESLNKSIHFTFVYYEDELEVDSEQLARLMSSPTVKVVKGLPDILPDSNDIILLVRGRDPEEVLKRTREGIEGASYDPSITTEGSERIMSIVTKYGEYAKVIAIYGFNLFDYWLSQETFATYDWKEAVDFILTPWEPLYEHLTYLISGSIGINTIEWHRLLRSWIWIPTQFRAKYPFIDVVYTFAIYDPSNVGSRVSTELYDQRSTLLSNTDAAGLRMFDKKSLPFTMRALFPTEWKSFLPVTTRLNAFKTFEEMSEYFKGGVCIVKPTGAGACTGRGMTRVVTEEDFNTATKVLYSWETSMRKLPNPGDVEEELYQTGEGSGVKNAIVSAYVNDPYLYEQRKFHFRVHLITTTWGITDYYPRFNVLRASKPYIQGDYTNKDIHDSHLAGTEEPVVFPDDFSDYDREMLWPGIRRTMDKVIYAVSGKVWSYPETKFSYEIFGVDLLPDSKGNCWLLEINTRPGMSPERAKFEESRRFHVGLAQWIHTKTVEPVIDYVASMRLVPMESSTEEQREGLLMIASDPRTMENVGMGGVWTKTYIEDMYIQSIDDSFIAPDVRSYFNWIMTDSGKVVGFVSFRRGVEKFKGYVPKESDMQIRVFVSPQGVGYGKRALSLVQRKVVNRRVYAVVASLNTRSVKLFVSSGMYEKVASSVMVYGQLSDVFLRRV